MCAHFIELGAHPASQPGSSSAQSRRQRSGVTHRGPGEWIAGAANEQSNLHHDRVCASMYSRSAALMRL